MKNFVAASRKPDLISFGLLPAGTNLDWIETNLGAAGAPYSATPIGVKDGSNRVFDVGAAGFLQAIVVKNRQVLESGSDFILDGSTLTYAEGEQPHADDSHVFWGWQA